MSPVHQDIGRREVHYLSMWGGVQFVSVRRTMREIADEVAAEFGLTRADLNRPERCFRISRPRQEAIRRCRLVLDDAGRPVFSYPQIARFFGLKDHTTAIHAERAAQARRAAR